MMTAGLAAASAIAPSLSGCGSGVTVDIPCLGPAAAPAPVPGMTYIRASKIGCALDCRLEDGRNKYTGGDATDDGPRINAAMSGASASNPITLIIDGSALISGLFLPAGGYWGIAGLGCGTGFFVETGTNNDGIHNGPPIIDTKTGPAPARGKNVTLSNFTLNGNQGDGHNGDSTSGEYYGVPGQDSLFGIHLLNLDNITVENVVVVQSPTFHIRFSNTGHVTVSGCWLLGSGLGTDGLHFDGPANDITITNCTFATGDDSIALNCPEGYSGDISRVAVSNCTFNSWTLMRLYTTLGYGTQTFQIDTVSVKNCNGTLAEAAFLVGTNNGSAPDCITSFTIADCSLTAPTILALAENFGNIVLTNVVFTPSQSTGVVWVKPQVSTVCAFVRPSPLYGDLTSIGSSLTFNNCTIHRTSDLDVTAVMLENNSAIGILQLNGLTVQDAGSYGRKPVLLGIGSKLISQLVLNAVDSENFRAPESDGELSRVNSVSGPGVLATNWEFPDAVMADGVPYISASSGLPSIKVDGVVEPYPIG